MRRLPLDGGDDDYDHDAGPAPMCVCVCVRSFYFILGFLVSCFVLTLYCRFQKSTRLAG